MASGSMILVKEDPTTYELFNLEDEHVGAIYLDDDNQWAELDGARTWRMANDALQQLLAEHAA